jgi:hypothetical protein
MEVFPPPLFLHKGIMMGTRSKAQVTKRTPKAIKPKITIPKNGTNSVKELKEKSMEVTPKENIKEATQEQALYADLMNERTLRFKWMLKAQEINRELTYYKSEVKKLESEVETLTLEAIRLKSKDLSDKLKIKQNDILTNEHPEYKDKWVIIKSKDE